MIFALHTHQDTDDKGQGNFHCWRHVGCTFSSFRLRFAAEASGRRVDESDDLRPSFIPPTESSKSQLLSTEKRNSSEKLTIVFLGRNLQHCSFAFKVQVCQWWVCESGLLRTALSISSSALNWFFWIDNTFWFF